MMQLWPDGSQGDASNPSSISSTLLDQLRSRRPEAWQRLVRLYGPVIYRWCRRSNLHAEDAADVVQEVLSAVMVHLPDFRRDGPQDSFGGWLATITAYRQIRKKQPEMVIPEVEELVKKEKAGTLKHEADELRRQQEEEQQEHPPTNMV